MKLRQAERKDLKSIIEIEQICFPPEEAAGEAEVTARFAAFPENFFVAEEDGRIIGFVNGAVTELPELPDALYHDVTLHRREGAYQTVFGLDVLPEYRKRGIGAALLAYLVEMAKSRGKKGVVLTCKDELIPFYEHAGFVCQGISASCHGGAKWNDMLLEFSEKKSSS